MQAEQVYQFIEDSGLDLMEYYRHAQTGWITIGVLLSVSVFLAFMLSIDFNWIGVAVLVALFICLLLFYKLTVVVDDECIHVRFGIGPIGKRFLLKDIDSCKVVKNPWYCGWGIRWVGCWVYNISGFDAVELRMKNGRRYRIGTDEPAELENIIRQHIEG